MSTIFLLFATLGIDNSTESALLSKL